jgi:hypothetical protein
MTFRVDVRKELFDLNILYMQKHLSFVFLQAKGLSQMRGNSHVRFLGGWRVVPLSSYPVDLLLQSMEVIVC